MKIIALTLLIGVTSVCSRVQIINAIHPSNENSIDYPPQCSSKIFCYGTLLETFQMAGLYNDSKTFVDMKLKQSPDDTLTHFDTLMATTKNNPTRDDLYNFIAENFDGTNKEFENWTPTDFNENPVFLNKIKKTEYRDWASKLNSLWLILGRKMTADVAANNELYSIIHVPNPVIVPGGRFREFYYWDSYWIVRGLLLSEMYTTCKGMLENFLSIIERFGYIPNGGRIYYTKRSQPPLLSAMIKAYVDTTHDKQFAIDSVDTLEQEFQFFMNNHTVEVNGHVLAYYGDKSSGPRPESYKEDVDSSRIFNTDEEKEEYYSELKAAAESGMDFSSRWFINAEGTNKGTLTNLKTRSIIPVELNAILFWNAKIISEFYLYKGNAVKAAEYECKAQEIQQAIDAVLWNEEAGAWLDYDMINNKPRNYFVPTNLSPLWMNCYNASDSQHIADRVLHYITTNGLDNYPGGVPNTLEDTGEQWDFPNVWPPMQYILVKGLANLPDQRCKDLAKKWAERWVLSNYLAFTDRGDMYEKYDATEIGGHGGGGEYDTQIGFGWSNGVIMELLDIYGAEIGASN